MHLAFPIRLAGRGLVTVEHDSDRDIAQSVRLLLSTRPGERRSVPDYGLPDPLFGGDVDEQDVAAAITEWEERADLELLDVTVHDGSATGLGYGTGLFGAGPYGG